MPIYEYICKNCQHEFEALVRNSQSLPDEGCPECNSKDLQRKLSTFSASVPTGGGSCGAEAVCPHASSHSCCGGCCHHNH
ncbi:MAG: zinc ribbon domain-containing protein [Lentisphaeria bacterium]|nr:zinc ribbon domain-containing protein [Lentisphaeria bacterium]